MVHWGWIPISLVIGAILGMFILAFCEVSRREDEKNKKE